MTNRTTKSALLMSALALLLCIAMLMGTTYAWFTDEVTSGNNIIKSGNLDIELEYWNGTKWATVEDATDILTNTLWEPGVTEVAYLRVANAGSLALKYQLGINIISEKDGVNVDGKTFKLSDYIQFGVVEGIAADATTKAPATYATREEAVAAVTSAKKISAGYTKASAMASGDELYLALVVYMPTNVDNKANHDGTNVPVIKLGLNVVATQVSYEEDSFDKYYDGATPWYGSVYTGWYNTTDTEFVIGTAEELAGLAKIVNDGTDDFAGKTIKLVSNIDLNNLNWTPVGSFDYDRDAQKYANYVVFRGNFDGQGHTISNLKIDAPKTEGVALFACAENGTIENLTVNNVDIVAGSHAAAILGRGGSAYGKKNTITNCHVTGNINIELDWAYAGAIVAKANTLSISNCTVTPNGVGVITANNRNAVGSIVGWVEQPSTIANCKASNMELTGWANIGSITGFLSQGTTMSDCYAENIVLTKTRVLGHPTIGLLSGGFSYTAGANNVITVANNTVKNITLNGTHIEAPASANILYGAEFAGNANSNVTAENNTTENITNNLVKVVAATPATIQNMINDAAAGTVIGLSAGTYTDTIVMKSGITLIGDTGVIVHGINLNSADNVTLKGITFNAAGAKLGYDKKGNAKQYANIITGDQTNNSNKGAHNLVIDGCTFTGTFANGGAAIAFADYYRTSGFSGNITIKNCTFDTVNSYYDIYGHYTGNGLNGHGDFIIEGNTFKSVRTQGIAVYLGRYASSTPVVVKGNTFANVAGIENAVAVQDHSTYGVSINATNNTFATVVDDATELQNVINNAKDDTVITLKGDIAEDITVVQKPGVVVTIDGNGKNFEGSLLVDGKSGADATEGLVIKDVVFTGTLADIEGDACIRLGDGTNATRYTSNVSIINCTFDVEGAVGIKSYTGGDKNLTITGCTATAKAHSLAQLKGVEGVIVEDCVVESVRGINFNNSFDVVIDNCSFDVQKYAVRFGEGSAADTRAETYLIKNCELKSTCVEDAVIVLRGTAAESTLTIENTTIVGTPDIENTATNATVIK